jgi:5'-3' exonuclease
VRGATGLAAMLDEHRERALLYRKLATLVTDVPLAEPLEALRWSGVRAAEFEAWCEAARAPTALRDLGMRTLAPPA